MHKRVKAITIIMGFLMLAALSSVTAQRATPTPRPRPQPKNLHGGAVYVLANQVDNAIAAFQRAADGSLSAAGEFPTGGAGDPVAIPPDPPTDPLASQGALVFGPGNQFLFTVNAGSNQISVLRVRRTGLDLVDVVDSGGVRPISLTVHEDLLYVLNEGGTPNIAGFTVGDDGILTPLAGSTQPLIGGTGADPAQVGASYSGGFLRGSSARPNRPTARSPNAASPFNISPTNIPTKKVTLPAVTKQTDQGYPQARQGRGKSGSRRLNTTNATQQRL
jgi:6-phosphogluconolactonase (cycloisomerase 2 family)